ncbi:7TM diverse intracellular signaling domain-containing protein [Cytophagaceae bacterium ABcell3]|nr:7TM diverse intracellular signaling domain-containing protein [Cytophagaceae bacterium ABcell3]
MLRKLFLILLLLFLYDYVSAVNISNGTLKLSEQSCEETASLSGTWYFSWGKFVSSQQLEKEGEFATVPGEWKESAVGFCTYGLKVVVPDTGKNYTIYIPSVHSAYKIYIDDVLVGQVGKPTMGGDMVPQTVPRKFSFRPNKDTTWLVFHVSNHDFVTGGINVAPVLGHSSVVEGKVHAQVIYSALIIGGLLIIGVYYLGMFVLKTSECSFLFFSLICLFSAIRESFAGSTVFFLLWPEADWHLSLQGLYLTFPFAYICFSLFISSLFPDRFSRKVKHAVVITGMAYVLLVLVSPNAVYGKFLGVIFVLFASSCIYIFGIVLKASKDKAPGSNFVLVGMVLIFVTAFNDILNELQFIESAYFLPVAFFAFVVLQSLNLAQRYAFVFKQTEAMAKDLLDTRAAYEKQVEQTKTAEKLKEIEAFKNRFFSNVTHEFRTPLTVISLLAGKLEKYNVDQKVLAGIRNSSNQLLGLVNQLLDMGKADSGAIQLKPVNLNEVVKNAIVGFSTVAENAHIKLVLHNKLSDASFIVDLDKFEKVLNNLLSNALKFTPPGGLVEVSATVDQRSHLKLVVSDSGRGISEEEKQKVFDRFYQVQDAGQKVKKGTGIGLALVKECVESMHGTVSLESTLGKGSTFTVDIPLIFEEHVPESNLLPTTKEEQAADLAPSLYAPNKPLVLLAEDNEALLTVLAEQLREFCTVICARTGSEAWAMVQDKFPEFIISDVMMPEIDGFELCRRVKTEKLTSHIGVILLTAKATPNDVLQGLGSFADDYLTKPFLFEELKLRIRNFFSNKLLLKEHLKNELNSPIIQKKHAVKGADPFLNEIYAFLDKRLDDSKLSVSELAHHMSVSSKTLNRKLSAVIGVNANEVIRNYRLKRASVMLKSGYSVTDTAYQTGFSSPFYFGQCFKALYGMTPTEFIGKEESAV